MPSLNLTMMPFLVDSYAQGWKLYDESQWLQAQFAKAPAKGFRFLATWEAGFRSMTTRDMLATPADAKGKKLRTFPNEMMRWTLEAMGFNIQIMPLPEVYLLSLIHISSRRPTAAELKPLVDATAAMDRALQDEDLDAWAAADERFHAQRCV